MKKYSDISILLEQKAAHRRKIASLPVEEKMRIAKRLQDIGLLAPGKNAVSKRDANWTRLLAESRPKKRR